MATGTIRNGIKSISVPIANLALDSVDAGFHYKLIGTGVPTGHIIIGWTMGSNYSCGLNIVPINGNQVTIQHPTLTAVPANTTDITFYYV